MRELLLIGFLVVTAQVSSVQAACAWILWTQTTMGSKSKGPAVQTVWEPTAFDTHEQCNAERDRLLGRAPKKGEEITRLGNERIVIKNTTGVFILSAKCLPDSMRSPP